MSFRKLIFPLTFLFFINSVLSQEFNENQSDSKRTVLYDTSGICNIMLTNGNLLKEVNILAVEDSTFTITKSGVDRIIPIAQLHKITFIKNGFWPGFAVGAGASIVFWTLLAGINSHDKEDIGAGLTVGLMLAVPTGLVAGLISGFSGKDEVYNFGKMDNIIKAKRLKYLIMKNK